MEIRRSNVWWIRQVVAGALFLKCSIHSHKFCSIDSPSNCFVWFEKLIIHDTKLIPPNKQQEFFSMNIWLICRYWNIAWWSPWFSSPVTIRCRKPFHLCLASSISHVKNLRSTFLGVSSYRTQFPYFWIIPNDFKQCEIAYWVTRNVCASSSCV